MRQKDLYYSLPLKLDGVMRGEKLDDIDTRKAIHQNIRLILKSFMLCYRFDPMFGSILNKYHATTPPQKKGMKAWREEIREATQANLKDMLQRYETRVNITDVMVDLQEPNYNDANPVVRVKVDVHGQLSLGRKEKFHYPDSEVDEDAKEAFPLVIPVGGRK